MVKRQPADEDVGRARFKRLPHSANVGEQVGMGEHDAFGITGATGCILYERHRVGARRQRLLERSGATQLRGGFEVSKVARQSEEQRAKRADLRADDENTRASIAQDASLPSQVLLD